MEQQERTSSFRQLMTVKILAGTVLGVVAVVLGVWLSGTKENPWNLATSWIMPALILEGYQRSSGWRRELVLAVVFFTLMLSGYGWAWTFGFERDRWPPVGALLALIGLVWLIWLSNYSLQRLGK